MANKKRSKWVNFLLLYLGGVIISLSQLKIIPIQNEIVKMMGFSLSSISWLMSIFTLSGIFLSIPGGRLVTKFGPKKLLVFLMLAIIIGNGIGFISENFILMLFSRLIEGIAFSMIIMVGIVFINEWFKDGNRGLATGIWGTFSAAGSLLAMNIFLPMTKKYGIKSPWIFTVFISIILLIVYIFKIKDISKEEEKSINKNSKKMFKEAITNKYVWILAIAQGCMAFVLFTFINTFPLIYGQKYEINSFVANRYAGYFGLFGIPFGAIAGYLIDKTKKEELITVCSFFIMTIAVLYVNFLTDTKTIILQLLLLSAGTGLSSACVMIVAPNIIKNKKLIGVSISFINFIYYIGIFIGTPIIIKIVEITKSWTSGIYMLVIISLVGFLSVFTFAILMKKKEFINTYDYDKKNIDLGGKYNEDKGSSC
ncbi:MFS transporter [Clostridium sporogenes]|uniref:MFS transporter n=1 Tax=Clostridium sporogenes TaxID=1509 RepID=UPI00313CDFF7